MILLLATAATQTVRDIGHDDALFTNAQQIKNMAGQIAIATGTALANICTVRLRRTESRYPSDE